LSLGGRAVSNSHRGTIVENTSRKSMAAIGMSGSTSFADEPFSSSFDGTREGQGNEANKDDEEEDEEEKVCGVVTTDFSASLQNKMKKKQNEKINKHPTNQPTNQPTKPQQERLARQKKLGREAKAARVRQRMKQNAVVTNLITTLKGDLQKGMAELDEVWSCMRF